MPRPPGCVDTPDLSQLDSIDSGVVLGKIKTRHEHDAIYTRCGSVLIAVNPYKKLGVYEEVQLAQYKSSLALEREPPHVFAVASAAHRAMISEGRNQAIIVSGESGAGKTESATYMLLYLRFVSNTSPELEQRIYGASPLTEAFGCAKTVRHPFACRSSRVHTHTPTERRA